MKSNFFRFLMGPISIFLLFSFFIGMIISQSALPPKQTSIVLVLKAPPETAEFWEQVLKGAHEAVEEFDVDLTVAYPSSETAVDEQILLMEQVRAARPDVIILSPTDYTRLAPVTQDTIASGIPVVALDSDVNAPDLACLVASDNLEIGRLLGQQLMAELPSGGEYAILSHSATSSSGIQRTQGALSAMELDSRWKLVGSYECGNDYERAYEIMGNVLTENEDLKGIICTNEVCNLAVANVLLERKLEGQIKIIGCDNSKQQIEFLEQNIIQAIVIQKPFSMGYMAVERAVRVSQDQDVPEFTKIDSVTISQDNMHNSDSQKLLFPF